MKIMNNRNSRKSHDKKNMKIEKTTNRTGNKSMTLLRVAIAQSTVCRSTQDEDSNKDIKGARQLRSVQSPKLKTFLLEVEV